MGPQTRRGQAYDQPTALLPIAPLCVLFLRDFGSLTSDTRHWPVARVAGEMLDRNSRDFLFELSWLLPPGTRVLLSLAAGWHQAYRHQQVVCQGPFRQLDLDGAQGS